MTVEKFIEKSARPIFNYRMAQHNRTRGGLLRREKAMRELEALIYDYVKENRDR